MNQIIRMRECLYIFITCIVAIIFLSLMPKPKYTPKGIYLPNPNAMPSANKNANAKISPNDVKVTQYAPNTEPSATINIQKYFDFTTQNQEQYKKSTIEIVDEAKKIAAKHGCNLLQITQVQPEQSPQPVLSNITMKFYAYKI
jgi:hypothetical protein